MTKIVFMGTPDFSVPILKSLIEEGYNIVGVVTQPDRPKGRKKLLTPPPVKVEAEKHNLKVLQPEKIRHEVQDVLALEPDLIITAAFGQILPKELLEAPKYGCINVHASLLPELRGGAPIHYSILQGKTKTGITIMYMAEKLDAGDILTQIEVEIDERDNVGLLHDKLSTAGVKLLLETLPPLIKGNITPQKQDDTKATFASNIKREQERIDWSKTGEEIYNQIRGLNPWPVSFTTYQDQLIKIWWGEKVQSNKDANPGTILLIEEDGIVVSTGNKTAIKITELQPSGKKKMTGEEFLRGTTMNVGERLGNE
ncbi:methionyl-tRNA formyltransferase [Metabacillus halosaccharovorans]|uniref:Methionyl-tRNA formyltransferase n=1 Tax=Metabacillus halosaccharovorans TaxID=930124 RepID=A0ABT3DKL5_9BACI|nr:methionyl-tRNA formyltransferase [Metabacillus halosaccharovorans]MCV9887609.1 methionyl-tRNA formyltransferase [Metabacillus halosaccharovorans]